MTVRIGLLDDHPVVVGGLEAALGSIEDLEVVGHAGTAAEGARLLARDDIDVILLDVRLPDGNGIELLRDRGDRARPAVIVLSSFTSSQYIAAALRFGAAGFLLKTAPLGELVEAVRRVAAGGTAYSAAQLRDARTRVVSLTPRERQVVELVLEGRSNDEIGAAIGATRRTVETHLGHLFARYGVATRIELAMRAEREGWLDVPPVPRERGGEIPT